MSQPCQTGLIENFIFLSDQIETLHNCWLRQVDHGYTTIFHYLAHVFKRDNWHFSSFDKNFHVAFSSDTVEARSLKLCMIMTLLGDYIFIVGLMTLTLFQGHVCEKNKLQIVLFRFLSTAV